MQVNVDFRGVEVGVDDTDVDGLDVKVVVGVVTWQFWNPPL
jgi:hypothetical protein